jgi:hypothetical protein
MEYDSLPLLNAFLKETLRFYPAAPYLERVAGEDLVIPLASEITTISGERISNLPVKKGQFIAVAIASYQRYVFQTAPIDIDNLAFQNGSSVGI